jgi:hypothetical protein
MTPRSTKLVSTKPLLTLSMAALAWVTISQTAMAQSGARTSKVAPKSNPVANLLDVSPTTEFPQRRPGLWEIQQSSGKSMGLPPALFCVGPQTDHALEHLDRRYGVKGSCRMAPFKQYQDLWISDSHCKEGRNQVISQSILSGDLQTVYRIDTETVYNTSLYARREEREALYARYVSACPTNIRPGDLLLQGMGRLNMLDGQVVVHKPKRRSGTAKKSQG